MFIFQTLLRCHFLAVKSPPSCLLCNIQGELSGWLVQPDLSPVVMSLVSCVLSRLPWPSCPVNVVATWLSCPLCPALANYPNCSLRLSCPGYPVLTTARVLLSQFSCSCCSLFAVLSWPGCPLCLIRTDLSRLIYQADLSPVSCPRCPNLIVQYWLSHHCWFIVVVLS